MSVKTLKYSVAAGTVLALAVALMMFAPATVFAEETAPGPALGPAPGPAPVAYLSEALEGTFILAEDDVEWSYAEPNLPLEQGDMLQTNETGMAEVQFDRDQVLRIGERTRIAAVELGEERSVFGLDSGSAYLRIAGTPAEDRELLLTFPTGQVTAAEPVLARLDVAEDGSATLDVIRGNIELETTSEASTVVNSGERVHINAEGWSQYAALEFARRDAFGAWNDQRDMAMSVYRRPAYIEQDIAGAEDLEDYGNWVYSDKYNRYGWRPYVVEDWKPYYYGRWYDSPRYGWTWIPEEPWGYVTYHYGSWNYDPFYGWIWVPGYIWRPAYVNWVVYDDYVGWVPCGYYGYPVITTYPYYVTAGFATYFDAFSFTFVFRDDFHHHHHHHRHDHYADHRDGHDRDGHGRDGHGWDRDSGDRIRPRDRGSIELTDGRTVKFGRIDRNKARFVKNIDRLDLQKSFHKGTVDRRELDSTEMIDADRNPKLRQKIDKLAKRYAADGTSRSADIPKKIDKDRANKFDFRQRVEARSEKNVRPLENKRVRYQDQREIKQVIRPERRRTTIEDRMQNRRDVPQVERQQMPKQRIDRPEQKQRQIEIFRGNNTSNPNGVRARDANNGQTEVRSTERVRNRRQPVTDRMLQRRKPVLSTERTPVERRERVIEVQKAQSRDAVPGPRGSERGFTPEIKDSSPPAGIDRPAPSAWRGRPLVRSQERAYQSRPQNEVRGDRAVRDAGGRSFESRSDRSPRMNSNEGRRFGGNSNRSFRNRR